MASNPLPSFELNSTDRSKSARGMHIEAHPWMIRPSCKGSVCPFRMLPMICTSSRDPCYPASVAVAGRATACPRFQAELERNARARHREDILNRVKSHADSSRLRKREKKQDAGPRGGNVNLGNATRVEAYQQPGPCFLYRLTFDGENGSPHSDSCGT